MINHICVQHNAICKEDGVWLSPLYDVAEYVRKEQKPVYVSRCPKCVEANQKTMDFLRGNNVKAQKTETEKEA